MGHNGALALLNASEMNKSPSSVDDWTRLVRLLAKLTPASINVTSMALRWRLDQQSDIENRTVCKEKPRTDWRW